VRVRRLCGETVNRGDEVDGTVARALPNALFEVQVPGGRTVLAHLSDALRVNVPRLIPGDSVRVQLSPFDRSRGRIVQFART
jgi:translation initiation factor IF-1